MIKQAAIQDKNGTVYVGKRHGEIFAIMPRELRRDAIQGFVTDTGKFVTRKIAATIAFECGQISKLPDILFSEDLY